MIAGSTQPKEPGSSDLPAKDPGLPSYARTQETMEHVADAMALDGTIQSPNLQGSKRKWTEASDSRKDHTVAQAAPSPLQLQGGNSKVGPSEAGPSPKRIKVPDMQSSASSQSLEPLHGLPLPIWRKILGLVPPVFLGRLIRVSKGFRSLLDPLGSRLAGSLPEPDRGLTISANDDVWIASRRRFAPGLPRNLPGKRDLEMWRLIRGNECQSCSKRRPLSTTSSSSDPWKAGPGANSIRVIWLLGIRCCGPCLRSSSEQVRLYRCSIFLSH